MVNKINSIITSLEGARIDGSEIVDAKGKHFADVPELRKKMENLFQSEVVKNSDVRKRREVCRAFCDLLLRLETIPKKESVLTRIALRALGQPFEGIRRECINFMRQDNQLMQRVIEQYNEIASQWNGLCQPYSTDPDNITLKQLRFLNDFLGIAWSKEQEQGSAPVPLYGELPQYEGEEKLHRYSPSKCETIAELNGLIARTAQNPLILKHNGEFETSMVKQIEQRIVSLQKQQRRIKPYSPGPRALETMMAIFELDQHRPTGSQPSRAIQKIWAECQQELMSDAPFALKISGEYNGLIFMVNRLFVDTCGDPNGTYWSYDLRQAAFFGAALGLKTPPPPQIDLTFPGVEVPITGLFQESYLGMNQKELDELVIKFTYHSQLLYLQMDLARKQNRLAQIERQLNPNNLSSLLLSKEKMKELQEERKKLKVKLVGMPRLMPKELFQDLWNEQLRRMELLGLKPTSEQMRRTAKLPLLGADTVSPIKITLSLFHINLPPRINWYNERVGFSNNTRERIRLEQAVEEQEIAIQDKSWAEFAKEMEQNQDPLAALRSARAELIEWRKRHDWADTWSVPQTLEFRAKLLQSGEVLPVQQRVTQAQIDGVEPWPEIDIQQIPRPTDEKLIPELKQLEKNERKNLVNSSWPDHWKENYSDALRKLLD